MRRLRHVARINPPVPGLGRANAGGAISFIPLEAVWADDRFDPTRTIAFSGDVQSYNPVQEGDLLVPKVSPTFAHGRTTVASGLTGGRALATSEVFVLRTQDGDAARFLKYRLLARDFLSEGQASWFGVAGLKRISADFLLNVRISNAAWEQRKAVGQFLEREWTRIEELRRLVSAQRQQLHEWERARVDELLNADQAQPLKALLDDACVGIVVQPAQLYRDDGDVLCFRAVNVAGGTLIDTDLMRISRADHLERRRSELHEGDVVVVRSGQAGAAAVVPEWADGSNCVDLLALRPNRRLCRPEYLAEVLNSASTRREIDRLSVGAIQGHLNLTTIRTLRAPAPALDEQDERLARIREVGAEAATMSEELHVVERLLIEYRDALVTEVVNGHVDIAQRSDSDMAENLAAVRERARPEVLA